MSVSFPARLGYVSRHLWEVVEESNFHVLQFSTSDKSIIEGGEARELLGSCHQRCCKSHQNEGNGGHVGACTSLVEAWR